MLPEGAPAGNNSRPGIAVHRAGFTFRGEQIKALRQMASGKFISASMPGVYRYEEETAAAGRRVIRELSGPLTVMPPSKSEV